MEDDKEGIDQMGQGREARVKEAGVEIKKKRNREREKET
uniref:Uncharacterized protein n=1 Tax=Trichinella nativa TaxID=6335 RepID=A0A0V1KJS0_9BILA